MSVRETALEIQQRATEAAKTAAQDMAAERTAIAAHPDASNADRLVAETAMIITEIAEKKASLVDRREYEAMVEEVNDWADDEQERIRRLMEKELSEGRSDFSRGPVREAIDHSVAQTEVRETQLAVWLERNAEEAWLEAVRGLSTL